MSITLTLIKHMGCSVNVYKFGVASFLILPNTVIDRLTPVPTIFDATQVYVPESEIMAGFNVRDGLSTAMPIVPVVP